MARLKSLMLVRTVGFEGVIECNWARHISREGTEPTNYPNPKGESMVNPIFRVIVLLLSRHGFASRKPVGTLMFVSRNMDNFEVEK